MSEREKWLAARKKGLGGSDAAAALGKSRFKTNVELWEEKTGRREPGDLFDKACVRYGKEAEKYLRGLFALDHPEYDVGYDEFGRIANNPAAPFLFATLDGELSEPGGPLPLIRRKGVLEIKTTEIFMPGQWEQWEGRVPEEYYLQVLHQLAATGYSFALLMAQIKSRGRDGTPVWIRREYRWERDEVREDMEHLLKKEREFWNYVEGGKRPPLLLPDI